MDGRPAGYATLEAMLTSISHRGQDGRGIWCKDSIGLAQCMRWSSRESRRERQPELSQLADLVMVADARIDNRGDLISALSITDRPAGEITDCRLILKAYQTWGDACPEKLEGDFAFAIWDSRQRSIFCARDTAGVKPFYYYYSPQFFAFASEIKALITITDMPRRLNERKVADFLLWSFEDIQDTFYQDIHRLPPAHTLVVTPESDRIRQYWALDPHREIHLESDVAYIRRFQEVFNAAVRCRMDGVSGVGSTLSGGLDSSSIACTARQYLAQKNNLPVEVFSVVFPQTQDSDWTGIDERVFIEEVLAMGGFEPNFIDANQINPLIDPCHLNHVLDEPYFAPTLSLFWGLFKAAQQSDIQVLLDGTDGDSTVSHGEDYLTNLARAGRWRAFYAEAAALAKVQRNASQLRLLIWKYGIRPFIPSAIVDLNRQLKNNQHSLKASSGIVRPEFALRAGYTDFPNDGTRKRQNDIKSAREKHWQEMTSGLNALSLELFDKASASFSFEMRFPFYDRRLMEYCLALPREQILSQGWTRYILRVSMQGILPENVRWRTTKSNLFQAFNLQFQRVDKASLDRNLAESGRIVEAYVDGNVLDSVYNDYWNQPSNKLVNAYIIYGVITLAHWLKFAGFV
jgi:asparagine synthase (glutamine-hydrolysing)